MAPWEYYWVDVSVYNKFAKFLISWSAFSFCMFQCWCTASEPRLHALRQFLCHTMQTRVRTQQLIKYCYTILIRNIVFQCLYVNLPAHVVFSVVIFSSYTNLTLLRSILICFFTSSAITLLILLGSLSEYATLWWFSCNLLALDFCL